MGAKLNILNFKVRKNLVPHIYFCVGPKNIREKNYEISFLLLFLKYVFFGVKMSSFSCKFKTSVDGIFVLFKNLRFDFFFDL